MLRIKDLLRQKSIQTGICHECRTSNIVIDLERGEIICSQCGLVLHIGFIDQRPEWRSFTPQHWKNNVRVGSPFSFATFDKGLSTTFQPYKDAYGKSLPTKKRITMIRLKKWHIHASIHSQTERNLSQAMNELTRLTDKLHVPKDIREEAALIYRKAHNKKLFRGRSIKSVAAATMYAACRLTRTPRSLKELISASGRDRKEIARCYRVIQRRLNLTMPIDEPTKYISKIASRVGLNQKTQSLAIHFVQQAKKLKMIFGKNPVALAATCLYIATKLNGEKTTQKQLAHVAKISDLTIRNLYKELDKCLNFGLRIAKKSYNPPTNASKTGF